MFLFFTVHIITFIFVSLLLTCASCEKALTSSRWPMISFDERLYQKPQSNPINRYLWNVAQLDVALNWKQATTVCFLSFKSSIFFFSLFVINNSIKQVLKCFIRMFTVVVCSFILLTLHSLIHIFIHTCRRSFTPFFQLPNRVILFCLI